MVTTCLSPVFVQIGAIPNFTATNPTLRLPGKRNRGKGGLKREPTGTGLVMFTALTNRDPYPPSTHVAPRAHLWAGWAFQPFVSCIPLPCSSSCTPGYPPWGVHQTTLWSLLSWHNPPKGQDCKNKKKIRESGAVIYQEDHHLRPELRPIVAHSCVQSIQEHHIAYACELIYFRGCY